MSPDAIQALVNAVDNMPAKKRVAVISGAGDRRDEDIRDQTKILGQAFDDVVLYQDACQKARGGHQRCGRPPRRRHPRADPDFGRRV